MSVQDTASTITTAGAETITLTDAAAQRIKEIVAGHPGTFGVRLQVDGGGCSGFLYAYSLIDHANPDDNIIDNQGAKLVVDEISVPFLLHASVDFASELVGEAFKVNNPNVSSQCGCGVSFSV